MRILLVQPGADFSIADLYNGLLPALQATGAEVVQYNLSGRIERAGSWLEWLWKRDDKKRGKPTPADVMYQASIGMLERALHFDVDWVLVMSAMYLLPDVLVWLPRANRKVGIIFTESPYDDEWQIKLAQYADACWVNEQVSVEPFRAVCPRTYYWQQAVSPSWHTTEADPEADADAKAHDVVFVGTGFEERIDLLRGINWQGIDFGLYGSWTLLGGRNRLRKHLSGGLMPNKTLTPALYRKAKIGLNLHRTSVSFGRGVPKVMGAESINPRCYELAACGCFFVSDYRAELGEVFGDLVPTFKTPREAERLIRYYLEHEDERNEIAAQLPAKVAGHTFDARAKQVLAEMEAAG